MAIAATHLTTAGSTTAGTVFTTASITPTANALILAWTTGAHFSSTPPSSAALTGNGLTWVEVATVDYRVIATPLYRVQLFRAMGASPSAGEVTITYGASRSSAVWSIAEFTGVDTGGTNGSAAIVQAVTGQSDASTSPFVLTLAAFTGADSRPAGYVSFGGPTTQAAGSGWTELGQSDISVEAIEQVSEWKTSQDTTVDFGHTLTPTAGGIAAEIAAAAAGASAALTGTAITGGVTESAIAAGGETIIITLTGDTWVATVGDDNAITTALIAGIDSGGAGATGWDAVVKAGMTHAEIVRTSDTIVTVTLAAYASYYITANETITATIPASALTGAAPLIAAPTFDITNEAIPTAVLTGTAVTGGVLESEIVAGGQTIIITLTEDTWVATIGDDNAFTTALIAGIDSGGAEAAGWDAVVKAHMTHAEIVRTSDTVVTITLAAEATYSITANETITVTVPATALTAAGAVVATPTFAVTNETPPGTGRPSLGWPLLPGFG